MWKRMFIPKDEGKEEAQIKRNQEGQVPKAVRPTKGAELNPKYLQQVLVWREEKNEEAQTPA